MKREFNIGDTAYLTNGKRIRTNDLKHINLKSGHAVSVLKHSKVDSGYLYTIGFNHDGKAYESVDEWLTNDDFMTKEMGSKLIEQNEAIEKFEKLLREKGIKF